MDGLIVEVDVFSFRWVGFFGVIERILGFNMVVLEITVEGVKA